MDHVVLSSNATRHGLHRNSNNKNNDNKRDFRLDHNAPSNTASTKNNLGENLRELIKNGGIVEHSSSIVNISSSTLSSRLALSPRLQKHLYASSFISTTTTTTPSSVVLPLSSSLSHGHGRNSLHRRRIVSSPSSSILKNNNMKQKPQQHVTLSTLGATSNRFGDSSTVKTQLKSNVVEEETGKPEMDRLMTPPPPLLLPRADNSSNQITTTTMNTISNGAKQDELKKDSKQVTDKATYSYLDRQMPKADGKKYIPPHKRNNQNGEGSGSSKGKYIPPALRRKLKANAATGSSSSSSPTPVLSSVASTASLNSSLSSSSSVSSSNGKYVPRLHAPLPTPVPHCEDTSDMEMPFAAEFDVEVPPRPQQQRQEQQQQNGNCIRGGCADPTLVEGSILDPRYKKRKASKLGKKPTVPYGYTMKPHSTNTNGNERSEANSTKEISSLQWEVGAVSECGIRDSNEDSFLIVNDLSRLYNDENRGKSSINNSVGSSSLWNGTDSDPSVSLFAVFDGHCGDQAARFAVERLTDSIRQQSSTVTASMHSVDSNGKMSWNTEIVEKILHQSISNLDTEFCNVCVEDGRDWESGATALIAALVNSTLVIANLGDARGVVGRSVAGPHDEVLLNSGWNELPLDEEEDSDIDRSRRCLWKEVTDVHCPNRADEKARIQRANGWVTTEQEIPVGQLQRMVLGDEVVVDILKRCFAERFPAKAAAPQRILQISRVCGELAVSRAIGDRDFKASFHSRNSGNSTSKIVDNKERDQETNHNKNSWECPLPLPYPEDHNQCFFGDLVSNQPDFQVLNVGEEGTSDEFLLMACDGLWDVIDADDAVRVTRDLLFVKKWPAKKAAARLAELAIHLGSSDNITVIVIRFISGR